MMVFWWTGKGYQTPVILFATLCVFGLLLQLGKPTIPDSSWFWGLGLITAGGLNWRIGGKANAKKLAAAKSNNWLKRLRYPARHRFMSLPFENWSFPMVIGGIACIVWSFVQTI